MPNERKRPASEKTSESGGAPPHLLHYDEDRTPGSTGLGPHTGGQSGDTAGLSRDEIEGPESVEELVEEGQAFEAGIISGVEDAPDADQGPIRTRQVPEDDVPQEYLDED